MERTHYCGTLRRTHIGLQATVCGWVLTCRDMGGVIFVDVRDREGVVQTVFDQAVADPASFALAERLKNQSVVQITGEVRLRDESTYNPALPTGEVELAVSHMEVLSTADTLPFSLTDEEPVREEVRLKYRYLDLRRPQMYRNLLFRHTLLSEVQRLLNDQGFLQVETPILCKSTPEGARDYLVPSRVHPGTFYALPQSPQIYKQLLMVSGIDKYYQVARCFRDEDGRADRQPEFTQFDMEMSFIDPEDIQTVVEGAYAHVFKELMGVELSLPLRRITWRDAMARYGSDKPDTRFGMEIQDVSEVVAGCGFRVFEEALAAGNTICAICAGGAGHLSRKELDALGEFVKTYHVKGLAWAVVNEDGTLRSSFAKAMQGDSMQRLLETLSAKPGDAVFVIADKKYVALTAMGQLRLRLGKQLNLIDSKRYDLLWVTEFPLLEWSDEENRFLAMHHPFTNVMEEDIPLMDTDPGAVRAKAYDLVMNGVEMGSGSIRIHQSDVQEKMFKLLGFTGMVEVALFADLLTLKEPPMRILFLIARQFNLLMQVRQLKRKGLDEKQIAEKTGLRSFVVRKYVSQSARFTWEELKEALTACVETEEAVKTGQMNDRMSVELLIIAYSGEKERRA